MRIASAVATRSAGGLTPHPRRSGHGVDRERRVRDPLTVECDRHAAAGLLGRPRDDREDLDVLATDAGGELYAKRQTMIEPIFADTKFNRRIDRFLRRGRAAARSEWRLTNAAHNLLKLWRHTTAPATP